MDLQTAVAVSILPGLARRGPRRRSRNCRASASASPSRYVLEAVLRLRVPTDDGDRRGRPRRAPTRRSTRRRRRASSRSPWFDDALSGAAQRIAGSAAGPVGSRRRRRARAARRRDRRVARRDAVRPGGRRRGSAASWRERGHRRRRAAWRAASTRPRIAGCLAAAGATVAVLGCGPRSRLSRRARRAGRKYMLRQGLLVSELGPGAPPLPEHFPLRNRIISGISLAVVVVEASEKSGSLITARCALEQGRDVMAVPGSVLSGRNRGSHACSRTAQRSSSLLTIFLRSSAGRAPRRGPGSSKSKSLIYRPFAGSGWSPARSTGSKNSWS